MSGFEDTILVHDFERPIAERLAQSGFALALSAVPPLAWCLGGFGCWIRTPGLCEMADRTAELAREMARRPRLVVASRLVLGGLSPAVKAVMDRSIGFLLPYLKVAGGRTRHETRYGREIALRYIFHGPASGEPERELAGRLARANVVNLRGRLEGVEFWPTPEAAAQALLGAPGALAPDSRPGPAPTPDSRPGPAAAPDSRPAPEAEPEAGPREGRQ
jgi:hypothetical protein